MNIIGLLIFVVFVFIVSYVLVVIIGGWYMLFSLKGIATRPPNVNAIIKYNHEDVEIIGDDNNKLQGWMIHSSSPKESPTVILIHGWNHTRASMISHINLFINNGYNVFAYDQRCHGASDVARMGFGETEGKDFKKVLDYLVTRDDIDVDKLVALGISLGGASIMYASPFEGKLKGIIWEGPWAFDECMTGYMAENRFGLILGVLIKSALALGAALWAGGKPNHGYPVKYIHKISPTPILFIRGNNDLTVPDVCAKAIIDACPEPKETWFHNEGGHRKAIQYYPEEYQKRVISFFDKYL